MHHVLSPATTHPPTEPGALAHARVDCSCGYQARHSLGPGAALRDAQAHLAWAAKNGR